MLSDKRAILQVLGCLMQAPTLLDDHSLEASDFEGEKFHELIFSCIYNLYSQGVNRIDSFSIDSYLSRYEKQYKIFEDNNGVEYCENAQELADLSNFLYYYDRLRKFSYLRELDAKGFDTRVIYDDTITDPELQEEEMKRLDALTIVEISEYVMSLMLEASSKFLNAADTRGQLAGKGMRSLKEELKLEPEIGIPTQSKLFNTIVRGARLKKFYLRSGNTGSGKCVIGSTLIPTEKGLIPIKDIPKYFGLDGNKCKVGVATYDVETGEKKELNTSHWYDMGESRTIKITTSQGYKIEGTPEHPIVIQTSKGMEFRRLDEIKSTDKIAISLNNNLFGKEETEESLAYLFGFLTGDGYLNYESCKRRRMLSYSKADDFMSEKVNGILNSYFPGLYIGRKCKGGTVDHDFGNKEIIEKLSSMGLSMKKSPEKTIPIPILQGNKEAVRSFLQGLFDTDGSIYRSIFEYSTASIQMANEVHNLLLQFGIVSNLRVKHVNKLPYYIITIQNNVMLQLFAKEIGFKYAKGKMEKLCAIIEKKTINSNIDFVEYKTGLVSLHQYLKDNYSKEYHIDKKNNSTSYSFHGIKFWQSFLLHKRTSRERIKRLMHHLPPTGVKEIEILRNLVNNVFFDEIKEITEGFERVYDFTVPETHCFIANGIISHNTRTGVGDICTYSVPWYYDTDEKKWVHTGFSCPAAFISTELDEQEMQTLIMAFVSGVNEEHICDGKYVGGDSDEEARVDKAIEFIESAPLYIIVMEDFDLDDIERIIRHYKREFGVQYFAFDYIQNTVKMMTNINKKTRGRLREDQLLLIMSAQIKMLCNRLNVHIDSFTQVNAEYVNVKEKNQNIIAGGKAIANKIDVGVIALAPSKIELETVKKKVLSHKINCPEPNLIYHVYKVRKGKLSRIMLWLKADLGTCRTKDLFVTDLDFNEIPVELLTIENIDKVIEETSIDVADIDVTEEEQQEAIASWGNW